MQYSNRLLVVFGIVFIITGVAFCQGPSVPRVPIDPRALALAPAVQDLPGFSLDFQRMYPGLTFNDDGTLRTSIPGISQVWSRSDGTQLYFTCVVAPSGDDALLAFANWRRNTSGAVVSSSRLGDFGVDTPKLTAFLQGNAFAAVTVVPGSDSAPSEVIQLKESVIAKTMVRFSEKGIAKRNPFSISTQVISKHAKPSKNERVQIKVSPNETGIEVEYETSVTRANEVIYHAVQKSRGPVYIFEWNGLQSEGQPAHNGEHRVEVIATDAIGRTASVNNIGVQVGK